MTQQTRRSVSRICFVVFAVIFLLSTALLSAAGGNVPIYVLLAMIGVIELLFGNRRWTVIGVAMVVLGVGLAIEDYRDGVDQAARILQIRANAARQDSLPPAGTAPSAR